MPIYFLPDVLSNQFKQSKGTSWLAGSCLARVGKMDDVQASKRGFTERFCLKPNKSSEDKSGRCRLDIKKKKKTNRKGEVILSRA